MLYVGYVILSKKWNNLGRGKTSHNINQTDSFVISRSLGNDWSVGAETIDEGEALACLMYGNAREKSLNTVRSLMLKKMVGEDAASRLVKC